MWVLIRQHLLLNWMWHGDLALREGTAIAVAGANPTVTVTLTTANPENSFYRITGAPTGTMTLNSIANGVDGQIITLVNTTTIKLKISNNNTAGGVLTSGGAATLIAANGSITLQYSSGAARWYVTNAAGATVTDWIKATTADETAISTDNQYVTGNIGLGGHTGGAGDNAYNFANNAPAVPLVVVSPGIAVPAGTPTATGIRLAMPGTNGTKWPLSADFKLGSYATSGVNAQSQLDISLGNGATATPEVAVMSILGNGNVGIGTTTPSAPLQTVKSGAADQYVARFTQSNTTAGNSTFIGLGSENISTSKASIGFQRTDAYDKGDITFNVVNNNTSLVDATESDERMRIRSDGNVGINTTAPTSKLFVKSADNTSTTEIATFMANNSTYGVGITYNGIKATGSNAANALYLDSKSTGYLLMQTNGTGNVGIGTAAPARKLEVNNAMKLTNGSADANDGVIGTATFAAGLNIVGINTDGTNRKISTWGGFNQQQNDAGNFFLNNNYFQGVGNIYIGDAGATSNPSILPRNPIGGANPTYLRLGSASNGLQDLYSGYLYATQRIRIGTTSSPNNPVDIYGGMSTSVGNDQANYMVYIRNTSGGGGAIMTDVQTNANSSRYMQCRVNGSEVGCLYGNGSNSLQVYSASDGRLKTNIRNTSLGLNTLLKMKIRDYEWKLDGKSVNAGFIAQELYDIYPEAVSKGSDGELDSTGTWMVNYAGITPLLVKGIQDLNDKIEALEKENKFLKTKITAITDNNTASGDIEKLKTENIAIKSEIEELKQLILNTGLSVER
jgi:hypothetical protein